jgi:hypothetical protein
MSKLIKSELNSGALVEEQYAMGCDVIKRHRRLSKPGANLSSLFFFTYFIVKKIKQSNKYRIEFETKSNRFFVCPIFQKEHE